MEAEKPFDDTPMSDSDAVLLQNVLTDLAVLSNLATDVIKGFPPDLTLCLGHVAPHVEAVLDWAPMIEKHWKRILRGEPWGA